MRVDGARQGESRVVSASTSRRIRRTRTPSDRLEIIECARAVGVSVRMLVDDRDYRVSLFREFPLRGPNGALNGSLTRLNQGLDESVEC